MHVLHVTFQHVQASERDENIRENIFKNPVTCTSKMIPYLTSKTLIILLSIWYSFILLCKLHMQYMTRRHQIKADPGPARRAHAPCLIFI